MSKEVLECEKLELENRKLALEIEGAEKGMTILDSQVALNARDDVYYHFRGGVDYDTLTSLTYRIRKWTELWTTGQRDGPFTMSITSYGGDIFSGFGHYDLIKDATSTGIPIITEVRGYAASMGSVIAQAGSIRTITANGWIMLHEAAAVRSNLMKLADMQDQVELINTLQDRLYRIYADRCNLSQDEIEARCFKKDWWLPAEEALDLGFVDYISKGPNDAYRKG